MKFKSLLILFLFSKIIFAQDFFQYKISKPYCIFNFMQTATGSHGISYSLKDFIDEKTKDDDSFKKLCQEYKSINIDYNVKRSEFPESRNNNVSTYDLIAMNAVKSKNIEEFKAYSNGLLPLENYTKLFEILTKAEVFYDKIIWNEYKSKTQKHLKKLSEFKKINTEIFQKFVRFYNSSWTNNDPFIVTVYPIPGLNVYSTSTPHINSLCNGVPTEETDYEGRNGVVLHEMCHILYGTQSADFQKNIDSYFKENKSPFAKIAYLYIDEALATVLGNGWAYKQMNGKLDENDWYANEKINGFAKALFPLTEKYLNENKTMDKEFIDESIDLFSATFPNAIYEYSTLLYSTITYTDNFEEMEIVDILSKYFKVTSLSLSSPILHQYSIEYINDTKDTQFFIIDNNQEETLKKLSEFFPEISNHRFSNKPINLSFIDKKGRGIIILVLNNKQELNAELEKMKKNKIFDAAIILQK